MTGGHGHSHAPVTATGKHRRRLVIVVFITAGVFVDADRITTGRTGEVLDRLGECLDDHFDVDHCTFQLEPEGHRAHEPAHHA